MKRLVDIYKEKVNWLNVCWLRYNKTFGVIQFKHSIDINEPFKILDLRKGRILNIINVDATAITIPQTYEGPTPIDEAKEKDLLSMLPLIASEYHSFYENLTNN